MFHSFLRFIETFCSLFKCLDAIFVFSFFLFGGALSIRATLEGCTAVRSFVCKLFVCQFLTRARYFAKFAPSSLKLGSSLLVSTRILRFFSGLWLRHGSLY